MMEWYGTDHSLGDIKQVYDITGLKLLHLATGVP
jgi:hypothetical protein